MLDHLFDPRDKIRRGFFDNDNAGFGVFERFRERIEPPTGPAVLLGINRARWRRIGPGQRIPRRFNWRPRAFCTYLIHERRLAGG